MLYRPQRFLSWRFECGCLYCVLSRCDLKKCSKAKYNHSSQYNYNSRCTTVGTVGTQYREGKSCFISQWQSKPLRAVEYAGYVGPFLTTIRCTNTCSSSMHHAIFCDVHDNRFDVGSQEPLAFVSLDDVYMNDKVGGRARFDRMWSVLVGGTGREKNHCCFPRGPKTATTACVCGMHAHEAREERETCKC